MRFCGVQAHQELAVRDAAGEELGDLIVQPGAPEPEEGDDVADAVEAEVDAEVVEELIEEIEADLAEDEPAAEAPEPVAVAEPATEPAASVDQTEDTPAA